MLTRFRDRERLVKGNFRESREDLANPGCGWYHVYTFRAQPRAGVKSVEEEAWMDESCLREQLALALIDIGDFRLTALSEEALQHIRRILDYFRRKGKQLLLRFVYDTQGKGMQKEPATLSMVKRHMEQIGEALGPYRENILVLQGIFVGNWGEMHGSRFLDDDSLCELLTTLYRVTEGQCFLAVRTPAQWRRIAENQKTTKLLMERLALFNDGIFGSATDLGTYGTAAGGKAGPGESRSRKEELEWQSKYVASVPNGGEILSARPLKSYRQAAEDLKQMHVGYLNSIYHPEQLDHWKEERVTEEGCWQGLSGYDYIGRHLGYRFTVLDVTEKKGKKLRILIRNNGFGNLCEEAECFLMAESKRGEVHSLLLDTDAGKWRSGEETVVNGELSGESGSPGTRLYLQLKRKSDGKILRFANEGAGENVFLGEYL